MITFDLSNYQKFTEMANAVIKEQLISSPPKLITSKEAMEFFKEEFDLNVVIQPHGRVGMVQMTEEDFVLFVLKWG